MNQDDLPTQRCRRQITTHGHEVQILRCPLQVGCVKTPGPESDHAGIAAGAHDKGASLANHATTRETTQHIPDCLQSVDGFRKGQVTPTGLGKRISGEPG